MKQVISWVYASGARNYHQMEIYQNYKHNGKENSERSEGSDFII